MMSIVRKPVIPSKPPGDVEAFISGGGSESSVSAKKTEEEISVQVVTLRLPVPLLQEVDALRKHRRPSPSRHQWLLEAIYEKLERG